jgi:RNA polymerase sigma-70 factor (ECF subfamily)
VKRRKRRAPLMLQTVLGLDAARITSAFPVAPAAMGRRLVRVKSKIRDAGIPFAVPGTAELPERLEAVLEAIYAAYNAGWENTTLVLTRSLVWLRKPSD